MQRPKVSVILPAYNTETTVARAINSIREQTFPDWELIIADDGSTDQTAEIAAQAARDDRRIRLHRCLHRGLVPTLNEAIELARGPFLARNPQVSLVASQVRFGGDRSSAPGYAQYVDWTNTVLSAEEISMSRFIESPIAHPSVMYRREALAQSGGYRDTDWPEDYELWLRWLEAGMRFEKLNQSLITWNDSTDRLSRIHPRYRTEAFYACKCHYLARWITRKNESDRQVMLWGAGRITRKRFERLEATDVSLAGYIDINPRKIGLKIGGRPVYGVSEIPEDRSWFIIAGVGNRGAREEIRRELEHRGYREGTDYVLAA